MTDAATVEPVVMMAVNERPPLTCAVCKKTIKTPMVGMIDGDPHCREHTRRHDERIGLSIELAAQAAGLEIVQDREAFWRTIGRMGDLMARYGFVLGERYADLVRDRDLRGPVSPTTLHREMAEQTLLLMWLDYWIVRVAEPVDDDRSGRRSRRVRLDPPPPKLPEPVVEALVEIAEAQPFTDVIRKMRTIVNMLAASTEGLHFALPELGEGAGWWPATGAPSEPADDGMDDDGVDDDGMDDDGESPQVTS